MRLRLRHMEVLEAVLHTGSTLAAAEFLHVSQPVISRTLKHAEQRLGYALFRRQGGRLEPTPEAQALLPELEAFFGHWQRLQQYAEHVAHSETILRVAVNPALASLLSLAVMQTRKEGPDTRFSLSTLNTDEIAGSILAGRVDIGIGGVGGNVPEGVTAQPLGESRLVLLIPSAWKLGRQVRVHCLSGRPFIGIKQGYGIAEIVNTFLNEHGLKLGYVAEVQTHSLAAALAEQGLGATIVDQFTAETANGALVQRLPLDALPMSPILCFRHPRHVPGEAETAFVNTVQSMLRGA